MPEGRLERTRQNYEEREECLVHVPACIRVDDKWHPRRVGLPEGQIEVRDGVVIRRGEIVKK